MFKIKLCRYKSETLLRETGIEDGVEENIGIEEDCCGKEGVCSGSVEDIGCVDEDGRGSPDDDDDKEEVIGAVVDLGEVMCVEVEDCEEMCVESEMGGVEGIEETVGDDGIEGEEEVV